jgi:hypothetical protein
MSKLLKLKEWLTLEEAVQHISKKINETITVADLYRSAIDGDLKLSIYFVNSAFAIKGELCNVGDIKDQLPQQGLNIKDSTVHDIEGIWDLTMQGQEALEIKGYYEQINSGLKVTTLSRNGILLQQMVLPANFINTLNVKGYLILNTTSQKRGDALLRKNL